MTTMAAQITSLTVVYSTIYFDANQRKHQSSASLSFVWGILRDRGIPRTKGQLRGKCFHLMTSSWKKKTRDALHCHHYVCWLVPLWYTSLVVCLILSWFRAVEFYSHTTECIYWHWGNHTIVCVLSQYQWSNLIIWVGWWRCGCLVTWFCYQLIAKPGNKTAAPPSPDTYDMGKYITLIYKKS